MTRIIHLSDLHFGAHDPALIEPLRKAVEARQPDLVVVSGDFAQRGTRGQFAMARRFLDSLPQPLLCVPGNHDIPHFNPLLRAVDPYGRFRNASRGPDEPVWLDETTNVSGLNTANRWTWMRGKVTSSQVRRMQARLAQGDRPMRVAVMHHPLEHAALSVDPLMKGAPGLLQALPQMGARIVLSGHIHISHIAPFRERPDVLFVQNGTSLSVRRRGEANVFLTLDLSEDAVRITRHIYGTDSFVDWPPIDWVYAGGRWEQPVPPLAAQSEDSPLPQVAQA